jgi:UDP-glucose 4-epimerase
MRVALTGQSGLIGSAIAARLQAAGHDVRTIGRSSSSDAVFDLASGNPVPAGALRGCDALVHAAGVTDEDFADRQRAFSKALDGAERLAQAATKESVARLAYVSTAHVYGPLEGAIDEDSAVNPLGDYAIAHFATEQLFRRAVAAPGAAALLMRPCAVYGTLPDLERFRRWSLIPFDFPRQAIAGRIVLKSAGLQQRNFVAAADIARAVSDWLARGEAGASVRNVPGPDTLSVYDFAQLCARIARDVTGKECVIERPAAAEPHPTRALAFRSRYGAAEPSSALEAHVRQLAATLFEKAHP